MPQTQLQSSVAAAPVAAAYCMQRVACCVLGGIKIHFAGHLATFLPNLSALARSSIKFRVLQFYYVTPVARLDSIKYLITKRKDRKEKRFLFYYYFFFGQLPAIDIGPLATCRAMALFVVTLK